LRALQLALYQVDAFASRRFAGNPAAVCPLDSWLDDDLMQAIANENNLAETAFFVREGDSYRIRWFTPTDEVELCGHATLAAAHVLATHIDQTMREVTFQSRSGPLKVTCDGDLYVLDFPAKPPVATPAPDGLAAALGATPAETLGLGYWCLAVFRNAGEVAALKPDMAALERLSADAVIASAPGDDRSDDCDFVSRCFVPKLGIPEDPVTGSAHCVLTPYWAKRLGKTPLAAKQISARGGELACGLAGDRVTIGGRAVPYLEGRISI
jgi:PhzF family phenazine biosynthesis protein